MARFSGLLLLVVVAGLTMVCLLEGGRGRVASQPIAAAEEDADEQSRVLLGLQCLCLNMPCNGTDDTTTCGTGGLTCSQQASQCGFRCYGPILNPCIPV